MEVGQTPSAAQMADRMAIAEVLAMHCRGVDRADEHALKSAYWPEATVAYGGFNGNAHEFCAMLPTAIKQYAQTQHSISNLLIHLDGNSAKVETYVTAYHYRANADGPDTEMTYLGRYLDRFEKRSDIWRMRHRQVIMDWNQNADATAILSGPPFEGLGRGSRYPDDVVYQMLAE